VRADYGSNLPAMLGEGALVLVRILVAAERLRAVELAVAVRAAEEAEWLRIRVSGKEAELGLRPPLHFSKASLSLVIVSVRLCETLFAADSNDYLRKARNK
jgi:hypothetical protein